jgi:hypothetical protein
MRIAAWANSLATNLGTAMDPAITTFLEQTIQITCHQAIITARNPKLEDAIAQVLRPQIPTSCLPCPVAGPYVTPLVTAPTIIISPFPCAPLTPPPRFHGQILPFIDFDGRK